MSGPIVTGQMNVLVGKLPAARLTDQLVCSGPDIIAKGSTGVFIGKLPAARMTDSTAFGGVIATGCFTVLIGDKSAATAVAPQPKADRPCMLAAASAGVPFVRA